MKAERDGQWIHLSEDLMYDLSFVLDEHYYNLPDEGKEDWINGLLGAIRTRIEEFI